MRLEVNSMAGMTDGPAQEGQEYGIPGSIVATPLPDPAGHHRIGPDEDRKSNEGPVNQKIRKILANDVRHHWFKPLKIKVRVSRTGPVPW